MSETSCWSLVCIALALGLAVIVLPQEYAWLQPLFFGAAGFCLAASILGFSWPLWMRPSNPTLLQAQIAAFDRIQQFFGGLDEVGLRLLFDLPNMLRFNILLTRRDLQKNAFQTNLSIEMDNYFKDGQGRIIARYVNIIPNPSNVVEFKLTPGKIGVINTSKKFIESRQRLADLLASTVLPIQVQYALRDFDTTIEQNLELMIDVLNERFSHNPDEFIFAEDQKSPHYGRIVGEYATRFLALGPKANNIRQAIRNHLGPR